MIVPLSRLCKAEHVVMTSSPRIENHSNSIRERKPASTCSVDGRSFAVYPCMKPTNRRKLGGSQKQRPLCGLARCRRRGWPRQGKACRTVIAPSDRSYGRDKPFVVSGIPRIVFGPGRFSELHYISAHTAQRLIVTALNRSGVQGSSMRSPLCSISRS
jgi:hypothetical protein